MSKMGNKGEDFSTFYKTLGNPYLVKEMESEIAQLLGNPDIACREDMRSHLMSLS